MQKVLIFGATSAIAQATAKYFAHDGCHLFLVGRDTDKLQMVADDLRVHGAEQVDYVVQDLNEFSKHDLLIEQAEQDMQGIDAVLIAHGTLDSQQECQDNYAATEQTLRNNFLSIVSLLTPLANYFEQQRHGCIAVISSVAGDRGRQSNYIYGAAKGGLSVFLQGLRNRLAASHVCVLTVKPGLVDTPMTRDFKKGALWSTPEQVGRGIYQAMKKRKNEVYLPSFWWVIMKIIKSIPESIFKRLKL
ncbi:SDR family oxidoreductase [Candidatus Albibeggiatoa sp. nov. NOAA]|uniref:SDR family oxidoreductase n=1 Tax=Candidatus Albibeggiatoa sp. nov. NOAA TaxID=3162724 RepID=UPI003302B133|nr:SDR family oxidoreductase [Thiotrichaceae bacterium]